jgi:hypothetical protein
MAITAVNASYFNQGPVASGQILADGGSKAELVYVFLATAILDGSSTSFTLNFIDGTNTLPFTPRGVTIAITGGTQAGVTVPAVLVSAITNTGCTVNLSGAGTSANTLTFAGFILK